MPDIPGENPKLNSKICSKCEKKKPLTEFNFRNRTQNKRHSYCKDCGKIFTSNHYRNAKRQYLDRNLRSYSERRELVVKAKSQPCSDCGIQYPYYVMDFDHREDELKKFSLYKVHNFTKKAILREIAKCDVVCANCHRERTHQRRIKR